MSDVGSGKLSESGNEVPDIRKARRYPTEGKAGERGGKPAPNGSRQKARPTGRTKNDRRAQPLSPRSGGGRAKRGGGPRSPTNRGGRGAPPRDGAQVAAATGGTEGANTQARKLTRKQGARRGRPKGGAPPRGRGTPAPDAKHGREVEGVSKLPDYQEGNGGTGGTPQATASEPQYKATKRGAAPRSRQSAGIFPARRRRPAATEGSEERPSKEQARSKQGGRGL